PIPPVQRCVVAPKRQTPEEGRRNRRGGDHRCGASPVALERRSLFVEAMLGGLERKLVNGCAIDCHGESLRTGADSGWMPAGDAVADSEAAGQGLEPRLPDPESGVLPLDDPAKASGGYQRGIRRPLVRA